jgi:hypothetical protein
VSSISSNYVCLAVVTSIEDLAKEDGNLAAIRDIVQDQLHYPFCFKIFEKDISKESNFDRNKR